MTIYERARAGEPIDKRSDEYQAVAVPELKRSRTLCHRINMLDPYDPKVRELFDELFEGRLPATSNILTPVNIDRGATISIGENVFINWNFSTVSTGSVTIEDNVQIACNVQMLTANHDYEDMMVLHCEPIVIKKGVWIGAGSTIMGGVIVGEDAVVAAGSVVTKDVEPFTIVGGNPARVLKEKPHKE
ncbi:MAG: DapH/DapD/GlmU-related protein [Eubacteriales bacterium]|nr:DapH/DapD/GlmU-related protein [Eubacteriales bacterium]